MPIRYYKLFDALQRRGLKKTDLIKIAGISAPTVAKLSKGETVTTEVIEKICNALDLQPGDIMEIVKAPATPTLGSSTTTPKELQRMQQAIKKEIEEEHILLPWGE